MGCLDIKLTQEESSTRIRNGKTDNTNSSKATNPCNALNYSGGWSLIGSTRHCGHQWPIVPAPGDYDDGGTSGMIGRGNRSTRRKPSPVPLCPPQTPHADRTRTRAAAVGSLRLTAWATAWPVQCTYTTDSPLAEHSHAVLRPPLDRLKLNSTELRIEKNITFKRKLKLFLRDPTE
jgi:hypothetical protein